MPKITRVKSLIFIVLTIAAGFYFFTRNHKERKTEEDRTQELASDAYLKVADLNLVIPIVALLEPRYAYTPYSFSLGSKKPNKKELEKRAEFKKLSAESETAPTVDRAEILVRQYQYTGESISSQKICPLLKRDWAKFFCKGEHLEIMRKLPEKFYVVDKAHIDLFASHYTVGQEVMADQIHKLDLASKAIDISCDADGKFCTAGVKTSSGTLAVWTVWPSVKPLKSAQQVAETQGRAIAAFVKYGISSQPDFNKMQSEMTSILE
jgi:hypothetical protein